MENGIMKALGQFKSVSNYDNKPNQFSLKFENGRVFQSYDSIIVVEFYYKDDNAFSNKVFFGSDWNYSRTTSKYRNMWLRRDTKWCKDKVTKNEILVIDSL
jgi:hypothetical protein